MSNPYYKVLFNFWNYFHGIGVGEAGNSNTGFLKFSSAKKINE